MTLDPEDYAALGYARISPDDAAAFCVAYAAQWAVYQAARYRRQREINERYLAREGIYRVGHSWRFAGHPLPVREIPPPKVGRCGECRGYGHNYRTCPERENASAGSYW